MEATITQKFLPFIIYIISSLCVASHPKVFYIALPAMAICFHLYYPDSWMIQIVLLVIWVLFLAGTYRIDAFAFNQTIENKVLFAVLIGLSAVITILLLIWLNPSIDMWDLKNILGVIGGIALITFISYHGFVEPIALYVIAPLFVKSETTVNTTLADYYKIALGKRSNGQIVHSFVRFLNDPLTYEVGVIGFLKYRNKVEVPFSYIRCECLFGVNYIYSIKQLSQTPGRPSRWELSPTTKMENKIKKYVVLFAIGAIILGLITIGIMSIILNKK